MFSMKIIDYAIKGETELKNPRVNKHVATIPCSKRGIKGIVPLKNSNFIFMSSALRMDHAQK